MSNAQHVIALLKSHIAKDDEQFLTIALQAAARESKLGHTNVAKELKELVDLAQSRRNIIHFNGRTAVPINQPKGDLAGLLSVRYGDIGLNSLVISDLIRKRLDRIKLEYQKQDTIRSHGLDTKRKVLLYGPPGCGKSMTALALAGELHLPLFTIQFDGLITKFMGETAAKLRLIFEAIAETKGVYFFDEFDAIGATRSANNDIGEARRILNSFLQFLEQDSSMSIIIAATNHVEILDKALFRRFDDVIEYKLPDEKEVRELIENRLGTFDSEINGKSIAEPITQKYTGLSHAEISKIVDDAKKEAIMAGEQKVTLEALEKALSEREGFGRASE